MLQMSIPEGAVRGAMTRDGIDSNTIEEILKNLTLNNDNDVNNAKTPAPVQANSGARPPPPLPMGGGGARPPPPLPMGGGGARRGAADSRLVADCTCGGGAARAAAHVRDSVCL